MEVLFIKECRNTEANQKGWMAFCLVPASVARKHAERNIGIVIEQTEPKKSRSNGNRLAPPL